MDKKYNEYLWSPKQPRVYDISPLRISGTPMSEEDATMSLRAENLQQSLQQNPIFKSTKQWAAQQEQRKKEIAASKKWLELHPEDNNDDPYTIFERGEHQAIVDGKDPSYYEKMIDDGKQFTKGALTVLSLPYLSAAAAGAYGYGASLGARGLFAAQGIHGLANENGVKKTANLIKSGNYGRAALSGAGDALNAAMILPGAKLLGNAAKYGLKSTVAGDMLGQNVRYVPQSGKLFYNSETTPENRIPVGAYRQSPEQMAEKINQLNTKGFTVLGHGTGFGGQKAAKNIEREGLKIFRREGVGLVEDADITNTASFLGGPDTATKLSNWPHLNSRYISLFPSAEFRYVNGNRRYFDLFPKGAFEYIPEKKGKSFLDDVQGGWSVVEGKGGATKPSASIGYYDSKEGIFYPNSNYQYKPYSPKSNERTYLGLLERPSKLSEAELKGVPKSVRNQPIKGSTFDTRVSNDIIQTYSNGSWRTTRPFTEEQILAEKNPNVQENMKYSLEKWKKDNSNMYKNYIDDTSKFNTDLQEYINSLNIEPSSRYLDGELIDGVRETNPFVKLYRQYLYNNGTDASSISNKDLAKLLTAQEQEIRSGMTGIMADKSPLWHGSNSLFDTFDWQKYASANTGNSGAIGPGNYFTTQGVPYGFDRNLRRVRNMQPYFITDIRSTPSGRMMQNKGLLPEYHREYELVHNPEWLQQEVKRIVPGQNTTLYIDYNEPMSGIMDVTRGAGMLRRNTGIKSLFPHPSRLVRGEDGLLKMLPTNWDDPRVNFKQGGILKRK